MKGTVLFHQVCILLFESKNIAPREAFKLNSSQAIAETWPLKVCMIKVKLLVLGVFV
jgi:hypothetical protein